MPNNLEKLVWRALDNSVENGYEAVILNQSTLDTAMDLLDCYADLEGARLEDLRPIVEAWVESRETGREPRSSVRD